MQHTLRSLGLMLVLACAHSAHAQAKSEQSIAPYWLSGRGGGGVGISRSGVGIRLGVSGEYWLSPALGVGLYGSFVMERGIFGDDADAQGLGLHMALRGADHGHYVYFALGAGYARNKHVDKPGLCLGDEQSCGTRTRRYNGVQVSSIFAWFAHPRESQLEIGPMARFDVVFDPEARVQADFTIILGAELGFVL